MKRASASRGKHPRRRCRSPRTPPLHRRQRPCAIRATTSLPIAVGFGISTPEQAHAVAASAEAVVVGSAIVNQIAQHGRAPDLIERVSKFLKPMVLAVK